MNKDDLDNLRNYLRQGNSVKVKNIVRKTLNIINRDIFGCLTGIVDRDPMGTDFDQTSQDVCRCIHVDYDPYIACSFFNWNNGFHANIEVGAHSRWGNFPRPDDKPGWSLFPNEPGYQDYQIWFKTINPYSLLNNSGIFDEEEFVKWLKMSLPGVVEVYNGVVRQRNINENEDIPLLKIKEKKPDPSLFAFEKCSLTSEGRRNKNVVSQIDELKNLAVIVLGASDSGKSYTWHTMFGRRIRTGGDLRELNIGGKRVDVLSGSPEERETDVGDIIVKLFLVNGSPEERGIYVGRIITVKNPGIVLCSVQDIPEAESTFKYFADRGYFMFIQWLNPGYRQDRKSDEVVRSLLGSLPSDSFIFYEKDGNDNPTERVNEMKDFIYSWAKRKGML